MSSIDIKTAKLTYKGGTEAEMLHNMAKAHGCRFIYKYANDYGDKITHTDYKVILAPGDAQEQALLNEPKVHNLVLVYQEGNIVSESMTMKKASNSSPSSLYELTQVDSREVGIDRKLAELVACATRTTFNLLLERSITLSDAELMVFVNALRICGLIADESGHLLPELFSQIFRVALIENDSPTQHRNLLAILELAEVNTCIHGRSMRADALRDLAELIRVNTSEAAVAVRQFLASKTEPQVYRQLVKECGSFRAFVQSVESASTHPPPRSWWWTYQYYDAIAVFETLGEKAVAGQRKKA